MEFLQFQNQEIAWFYQFSLFVTYLSVENFHSCRAFDAWTSLNYNFSKIKIVQQKSVPYAMFSASSQFSRDGPLALWRGSRGTLVALWRQSRHFFCRFEDFPCVWRGLAPKLTRKPMLILSMRLDTIETDILWKFHQKFWHRGRDIGKRGTFFAILRTFLVFEEAYLQN